MKRIKEYDILRVMLIILVVIGHSSYLEIHTRYGGIYYVSKLIQNGIQTSSLYGTFELIVSVIYLFHMEAFIFLSGALFSYSLKKYNMKELFTKKSKSLLIPFFIMNIITIIIKYCTGYWNNSSSVVKDIIMGQVLQQGNSHLWFLPTLFLIMMITSCLEKIKENKWFKLILLLLCYYFGIHIPINIISGTLQNLIWFNLGIYFESKREFLINNKKKSIITFFIINLFYYLGNRFLSNAGEITQFLTTMLMISYTYIIAYFLSKTNLKAKIILDNSFEIYLLSDPINYIFLFILFKYCQLSIFSNNIYSLLIIITRIILQLTISIALSEIYKKCLKNKNTKTKRIEV